jgi:hypothetical protein
MGQVNLKQGAFTDSLRRFFRGVSRAIIEEVPPEFDACECCRQLDCPNSRFDTCGPRLRKERARLRAQNRKRS